MLKTGDTIAVVSPSWGGPGTFPTRYEAGKRQLIEAFGVEVVEMPHALKPAEWLHANPKARADDLMEAFADPKIDGIITSIGGDDCVRLLPFLDLEVLRANPKVFMGYSDTSVLHFACLKAGISSFYGPSIMAGFGENGGLFPYMKNAVLKTLFCRDEIGEIDQADAWTVEHLDWANTELQTQKRQTEKPLGRSCLQGAGLQGTGRVRGPLIGGCLDVFPMIVGTSVWPTLDMFEGAILFVETSEEAPEVEQVKRIIRNLGVQGILARLTGILIGRPGGGVKDLRQYDDAILSVVAKEFGQRDLPIIAQMDFGHSDPMCVLPMGITCEIDCASLRVSLSESAVT